MKTKEKNICPICGFDGLEEPYQLGSFDICPCCGIEFGYEDSVPRAEYLPERWAHLRNKWKEKGYRWSFEEYKPQNWNLNDQLKNLELNPLVKKGKWVENELVNRLLNLSKKGLISILNKFGIKYSDEFKQSSSIWEEEIDIVRMMLKKISRNDLVSELNAYKWSDDELIKKMHWLSTKRGELYNLLKKYNVKDYDKLDRNYCPPEVIDKMAKMALEGIPRNKLLKELQMEGK